MTTMKVESDNRPARVNPDVVGLWGFAFATLLSNISSLGYWGETSMMVGTAIFLGGLGQLIAGILCNQREDFFGLVAFTSFGLFWIANGFESFFLGIGVLKEATVTGSVWYLACWALFSLMLTLGSLKKERFLTWTLVFVVLLLFFKMLGAAFNFGILTDLGSWCGIICAVMAIYLAFNNFLKGMLGKGLPIK